MPDVNEMEIKITVPLSVEPAGDMPNKWMDGLIVNAERIKDRRQFVLPDEGTFQSRVAEPSSHKYSPMIHPDFVTQSGRNQANIIRYQYKNLALGGFTKYDTKLRLAFATVDGILAKRFKQAVENTKDLWAFRVADKTLRATGDRIRGTILGQSLFWMTGDDLANRMMYHLEVIWGRPYDFTIAGLRQQFRAAMMNKLVQGAIQILTADLYGPEITAQNEILTAICNGFKTGLIKPFVPAGGPTDSLFQFEAADPYLILHARIVTV